MSDVAVVVDQLSKRFRVYHERNQTLKAALMRRRLSSYEDFWALRDVSFEIPTGTTFGLIGDNGSGKSTLLKTLAKILYPDHGSVRTAGRMAALLEVGSGFHPELSGRDNVYLNGSILGMTRAEIDRKFDDIVGFSGVEQFIDQPVKNYSSGMYVRLGFSVAIHVEPDILLVDEVLAVGDAAFQERCAEKFVDLKRAGRTVVVVSHAMASVRAMCDEVVWLSHGSLVEQGAAAPVLDRYLDSTRSDQHVDESGRTRWGSGEAIVQRLDLVDGSGAVVDQIRSGQPLTVRLEYVAHERIDDPVFGLAMDSHDGVYLWASNTRDSGGAPPSIEGRGVIEYRVPCLALQPGTYTLRASVVDSTTTHVYDYVRDALGFSVTSGDLTESGGYLALRGLWGPGR